MVFMIKTSGYQECEKYGAVGQLVGIVFQR